MAVMWYFCFQNFSFLLQWFHLFPSRSMTSGSVRRSRSRSNGWQSTDTLLSYFFKNLLVFFFECIPNHQERWNQRSKIKYRINKNADDNPWHDMSLYSFWERFFEFSLSGAKSLCDCLRAPPSRNQSRNPPEMISPHPFRKQMSSPNLSFPQTSFTVISPDWSFLVIQTEVSAAGVIPDWSIWSQTHLSSPSL